jgi:hypothetical protein
MNLGALVLIVTIAAPLLLLMWNRQRVKGKILGVIIRRDKSVVMKLCELRDDFVIFENRAYDVYPDFVRLTRFPMGWPAMLQELVPTILYDEEDAVPLDWIDIDNRLESSMNLRSALDENWVRKLVHEAATEGGGTKINWRRIIPIALIVIGIVGLIILFIARH